jgi:hypothetical protein
VEGGGIVEPAFNREIPTAIRTILDRTVHLFPPPLEIDPNEGFTPEKDIFGLKPFGDQLTRLVSALEDPTVLLLDGKWGTGKTTFVKMWCGELTKAGIPNIYFDAFANDYHEDAFLTVAGEIVARAEELKPKRRKLVNSFTKRAVEVAKVLGRASLKVGIRAASAGVLTGEEIEGINFSAETAKAAGEETAKAVDELLKASLENHNADRLTFDAFRKSLSDLANELSVSLQKSDPATSETHTPTCPCVFIIDELDRCRPSFSLELLEKIKHFFSVPHFVFLLVSSLDQLEIAVRDAYGNIDSRTYLEKFYHLRLLLPVTGADRTGRPNLGASRYLNYLLKQISPASPDYVTILEKFSRVHPLSFRTLGRIHSYLHITTISMPKNTVFFPDVISVLCILKVIDPSLYDAARNGNLSFEHLDAVLHFSSWRDQNDPSKRDRIGEHVENLWRFVLGALTSDDEIRKFSQDHRFFSFHGPSRVVGYYCEMIDCFALPAS